MKSTYHHPMQRRAHERILAAKQFVADHSPRAALIYVLSLLVAGFFLIVVSPVGSGDTDLWYHINGGRLLLEFNDLPDTAFFSFTEDGSTWVNYFWGFQALTYVVHSWTGYPGLIALRAVLVLATLGAVVGLLLRSTDGTRQRAWSLAALALVTLVLFARIDLIRPHLVSYMMIATFILILECRRRWLPLLPLLTLVWVNLHGVEWVVGAAICGSYFVDRIWLWRRSHAAMDSDTRSTLIWTVACVPVLFANPYGFDILAAPFNTPADVYAYIRELRNVPLTTLLSPSLQNGEISVESAISLLFYGSLLAYGFLIVRGGIRLAPLLLSIVGLILLSRGTRFIWEWLLLSVPLWRSIIDNIRTEQVDGNTGHLRISDFVFVLALSAPFFSWAAKARTFYEWPVDASQLPIGVTEFIRSQGITGRLMAPANSGGYLAWRLFPQVLISADMQTPPTTPWTHFRLGSALRDKAALRRFVNEFHPDLIAIEFSVTKFEKLIKSEPDFRPVFFDDLFALYADQRRLPEVVKNFELRHLNPLNLLDKDGGSVEERIAELQRTLEVYPNGDRAQHGMVRLLIEAERFEEALPHAERYLTDHPENPNSHFLVGNVLEHLDRCEEAIPHFDAAFAVTPKDFQPTLHRHIASCAYLLQDFDTAYAHFEKGMNTYTDTIEPQHRFQYALSAVALGKEEQARTLLKHLLYVVDPTDEVSINKATALLEDL